VVEAAYFEARYRKNRGGRRWLDEVVDRRIEAHTLLRAEAAVLLVEGRYVEAEAKAQAGIEALPLSGDPGGAKAEGDWLHDILLACKPAFSG